MYRFRLFGLLVALTVLGFAAWLTYDQVIEFYGSGPPYFGRTTNMDKWQNPLPMLVGLDALAVLITAVAFKMFLGHRAEQDELITALED